MWRRHRRDDGFTLVEVVVSIAVFSLIIGASALVISNISTTVFRTKTRDQAAVASYDILEKAKTNNCGLVTGSAADIYDIANGVSARLNRLAAQCWSSLGSMTATQASTYDKNTFTWQFTIEFDTPRDGGTALCGVGAVNMLQPSVVIRTVIISWSEAGRTETRRFSTREALSPDSAVFKNYGASSTRAGSIMVSAAVGSVVRLTVPNTSPTLYVDRVVGASGCAWFPFLAPGTYTVTKVGSAGTQVVVDTGSTAPKAVTL